MIEALRRWRSRLPLRVQLVLIVLVLGALAVGTSALAGTAALRSYLLERVDSQLAGTLRDSRGAFDRPGGSGGRGPAGPPDGRTWGAVLDEQGAVVGSTDAFLPRGLTPPRLPPPDDLSVLTRRGEAFTVGSIGAGAGAGAGSGGGGQWRVRAVRAAGPGGNAVVVVAQPLDDIHDTVRRLALINVVAGLAVLTVLAGVSGLVVRASLRPLRGVEDTAEAIAAGDLSRRVPPADPRTEVGSLSGSFNTMVDRFESAYRAQQESETAARASEERMRRFVGDASHELRTPLTSIRGFSELYRQGAVPPGPDLDRLMRRVEDEAARMGLLVEDLLLLARLDQQRPLVRQPVDLLAVTADCVHDAALVAPGHPVRLDVGPGDDPPMVLGDDARLRQVVGNLLSNAVNHTPPGTAITVRLLVEPKEAIVEVTDEGPGMTAETAARVFERFYRADASRARAGASSENAANADAARGRDGGAVGAGLGLSIVAALVGTHDGTVEVRSAPGRGSTFTVRLPVLRGAHPVA